MTGLPRAAIAAALIFLSLPLPAGAQTVRGVLVERGTDVAIPGAFVVLEDSAGTAVSTTLTTAAGTWLLNVPSAGTYRLRADRIGYASSFSEMLELAPDRTLSYRLEADVSPIGLSEVEAAEKEPAD